MSRIAYVNGRYVPHAAASVHIEDRGYQFGDGVYEVCAVWNGLLIDEAPHFDRLKRSLAELKIAWPIRPEALKLVMRECAARNHVRNGLVYVQITRGVARRDHGFPPATVKPAVVVTARSLDMAKIDKSVSKGVSVVTMPDIRWGRCDIKSTCLLPNVLAKQAARDANAYEAWLVDAEGSVTEGSSTTAWIVAANGDLVTRPTTDNILPGVTRKVLIEVARENNLRIVERAFGVDEAKRAREAFLTAASAAIIPIVSIDGTPVGDGRPGPVAVSLRAAYVRAVIDVASRAG